MKWATTILIFCVAVLIGLGMVMLYSSSMNMEVGKSAVGAGYLLSQLVWLFFGPDRMRRRGRIDYRRWKKLSPYLLAVSVGFPVAAGFCAQDWDRPKGRASLDRPAAGCRIFSRPNWPS